MDYAWIKTQLIQVNSLCHKYIFEHIPWIAISYYRDSKKEHKQ